MAPALIVEAQHTSGIYHIQGIGGVVGEQASPTENFCALNALCLRALCVVAAPTVSSGACKSLKVRLLVFSNPTAPTILVFLPSRRSRRTAFYKRARDFGEGCLAGQPLRLCSATAMTDCSVMRIDKKSMVEVLHREHAFSDMFVAYLLTRNIRYEEDLVDQLFNSSEKRLARILLLLAQFGKEGKPETVIPKMSQESLAEMVGTTRSRVSFFLNRFREMGFVDYDGSGLQVHSSLLNVVLHD